jgi:hypothetical protein
MPRSQVLQHRAGCVGLLCHCRAPELPACSKSNTKCIGPCRCLPHPNHDPRVEVCGCCCYCFAYNCQYGRLRKWYECHATAVTSSARSATPAGKEKKLKGFFKAPPYPPLVLHPCAQVSQGVRLLSSTSSFRSAVNDAVYAQNYGVPSGSPS